MTKNYYKILGVLDDAENIVIRAAYKALAQKYHPDKWEGDSKEASQRMSEINEAYDVLSNPEKRKSFDATREKSEYQENGNNQNDLLSSIEEDWKRLVEYLPELKRSAANLSKISKQLEFTYKVILLETKSFDKSTDIAQKLERHYLEKYFGVDKNVLSFAKELILQNKKDAAKELNQAVKLLGSNVDSGVIIDRIITKFHIIKKEQGLDEIIQAKKRSHLKSVAQNLLKFSDTQNAVEFLELLKFRVETQGFVSRVYLVINGIDTYKMTREELIKYAQHLARKYDFELDTL